MTSLDLHPVRCPLCEAAVGDQELYPARLDSLALSATVFSARRIPDGRHFRIVRCRSCGLIRSDPFAASDILEDLYRKSAMTYRDEIANLRRTYGKALARLGRQGTFLEIGCGSGFVLEEAQRLGYDVWGVEPSEDARRAAPTTVREKIVRSGFRAGLFTPASFDVIAAFQVLDHLSDPVAVLEECRQLLKPNGVILMIHHNASAISARILGEKSPIVDVEHTFLYTPATMRQLLEKARLECVRVRAILNWVSIDHVTALMPLPLIWKSRIRSVLEAARLDRFTLPLPLGNLIAIARKKSS